MHAISSEVGPRLSAHVMECAVYIIFVDRSHPVKYCFLLFNQRYNFKNDLSFSRHHPFSNTKAAIDSIVRIVSRNINRAPALPEKR